MHRIRHLLLPILISAVAFAQSPSALAQAQANRAYDAKEYARCSELFLTAASTAAEARKAELFYSAACCQALDGKSDVALGTLEQAYDSGLKDGQQVKGDADFVSINKTPRFTAVIGKLLERDALFEKATQPKLRDEINAMVKVDQALRQQALMTNEPKPALGAKLEATDKKNTKRMKEIVAKYGWPGRTLVGHKASQGAWLLVQHADLDLAFQKQVLPLLEAAANKKDIAPANVAYLADRIASAEKRKQVYGTQFGPDMKPNPIEDEAHVDERRAALGLESMADYTETMKSRYAAQMPTDAGL